MTYGSLGPFPEVARWSPSKQLRVASLPRLPLSPPRQRVLFFLSCCSGTEVSAARGHLALHGASWWRLYHNCSGPALTPLPSLFLRPSTIFAGPFVCILPGPNIIINSNLISILAWLCLTIASTALSVPSTPSPPLIIACVQYCLDLIVSHVDLNGSLIILWASSCTRTTSARTSEKPAVDEVPRCLVSPSFYIFLFTFGSSC